MRILLLFVLVAAAAFVRKFFKRSVIDHVAGAHLAAQRVNDRISPSSPIETRAGNVTDSGEVRAVWQSDRHVSESVRARRGL